MNIVVNRFGWRVRFYSGDTSDKRHLWKWKFRGVYNINHGITLRLFGEFCLGIQWRHIKHDYEPDDI